MSRLRPNLGPRLFSEFLPDLSLLIRIPFQPHLCQLLEDRLPQWPVPCFPGHFFSYFFRWNAFKFLKEKRNSKEPASLPPLAQCMSGAPLRMQSASKFSFQSQKAPLPAAFPIFPPPQAFQIQWITKKINGGKMKGPPWHGGGFS
jgi:hypothetical protein